MGKIDNKISAKARPLIKWAGGKRSLSAQIKPLVDGYSRYYEPFFGGGAIFFDLAPKQSVLSDLNPELINCYEVTKTQPDELIKKLRALKNTEESYYQVRASVPRTAVTRAARFVYLCSLSFNGIYRVNQAGQFNVPYGYKANVVPCDPELIRTVSQRLQSSQLFCADFETIAIQANRGDCVYFDPPYTVAHGTNGFLKYNEKIFSWKDQERLESVALNLAKRGVKVVISNADHPSIRELYKAFKVQTVERWSVISGSADGRKSITECIFSMGD